MKTGGRRPETGGGKHRGGITALQRRQIFGLGRARGFDIDGLRELTPAGSISALTRSQAERLIAKLAGETPGRGAGRRARGVPRVTAQQLGQIRHLRGVLGFRDDEWEHWLLDRFGIRSTGEIRDRETARRVIATLTMLQRFDRRRRDPRVVCARACSER